MKQNSELLKGKYPTICLGFSPEYANISETELGESKRAVAAVPPADSLRSQTELTCFLLLNTWHSGAMALRGMAVPGRGDGAVAAGRGVTARRWWVAAAVEDELEKPSEKQPNQRAVGGRSVVRTGMWVCVFWSAHSYQVIRNQHQKLSSSLGF